MNEKEFLSSLSVPGGLPGKIASAAGGWQEVSLQKGIEDALRTAVRPHCAPGACSTLSVPATPLVPRG